MLQGLRQQQISAHVSQPHRVVGIERNAVPSGLYRFQQDDLDFSDRDGARATGLARKSPQVAPT